MRRVEGHRNEKEQKQKARELREQQHTVVSYVVAMLRAACLWFGGAWWFF